MVEDYKKVVATGHSPVFRGHLLTEENLKLRQHILNLMCRFKTNWARNEEKAFALQDAKNRLRELAEDQLIHLEKFRTGTGGGQAIYPQHMHGPGCPPVAQTAANAAIQQYYISNPYFLNYKRRLLCLGKAGTFYS